MPIQNLFKSQTLWKIMKYLCTHKEREFFVRELARAIDADPASVQRELANLEKAELIRTIIRGKNKYVQLNAENALMPFFEHIFLKDNTLFEEPLTAEFKEYWITPLTISINLNGWDALRRDKRFLLKDMGDTATVFHDNGLEFCVTSSKVKQCSEEVNQNFRSPSYCRAYERAFRAIVQKVQHEILKTVRVPVTHKRFQKDIEHLYDCGIELCTVGYVGVLTDFVESLYSKNMSRLINEALLKRKYPLTSQQIVSILSTPVEQTLTVKREHELYKIALYAIQHKKKTIKQTKNNTGMRERVKEYYYMFYWVNCGHFGTDFTIQDAHKEVNEIIKNNTEQQIKARIQEIEHNGEKIKKEQLKLCKDLNISKETQEVFRVARIITYFKALRLELLGGIIALLGNYVRYIEKNKGIKRDCLYQCSLNELFNIAQRGLSSEKKNELRTRAQFSVWRVDGHIKNETILSGAEAHQFYREHIRTIEKEINDTASFHGMVAYQGKVRGKVKILLNPREADTLRDGEILVTHQTVPEMLPAMKRASAFITNSGGITCHAAIVARELKKPCIVGTEIATKLLKDGDFVEVDAFKGIITIIQIN